MHAPSFNRLVHIALSVLMSLTLLTNCGGGVGTGGTGRALSTVAVGPINGYGSIIVNGVRFDDRYAVIQNDDGSVRSRGDLKLGMVTEVDGVDLTTFAGKQSATASSIRIVSDIVGPVTGVDTSGAALMVLGQTVVITPATVFDDRLSGGLSNLRPGAIVEVYGRYDAARSRYTATRIEDRSDATFYKLRGPVGAVDPVAKILTIGGQAISYAGLTTAGDVGALIGVLVRAQLNMTLEGGVWTAVALQAGAFALPDREDAQVEGRISAWTSSRQFSIEGIPVDASGATFFGSESAVLLGARVEVEGSSGGSVLHATIVKVEGDENQTNSSFELHGAVETLDIIAKTFGLHGVTVSYGGPVQFGSGGPADLAVGRSVLVQGTLSPDGVSVDAQTISFDGN
jgi:hypothetical protein